jgi:hypothetical protein
MIFFDDVELNAQSFLDYLKCMKEKIADVPNTGYADAFLIIRHITNRYISEHDKTLQNYTDDEEGRKLFKDAAILEKYKKTSFFKRKKVIIEFKESLSNHLTGMINGREFL